MSGLQGGGTSPSCGNGRVSGGSAGNEHRYSFPSVDCAKWENAPVGVVDVDSRWSGKVGPVLSYPNTMGQPRGKMMGPMGGDASPSDFPR